MIHKSGGKTMPSNYKPLSQTCTCGNILFPRQHGFRRGLPAENQLVQSVHNIASSVNERRQTDKLWDFSRAFATVPHTKLVKKFNIILGESKAVAKFCVTVTTWYTLTDRKPPKSLEECHRVQTHRLSFLFFHKWFETNLKRQRLAICRWVHPHI